MRVQPLIIWLKSSLQRYALCVVIVLLLRLVWPPVDGKQRYKRTNYMKEYGCTYGRMCIPSKAREEEPTMISSFQAIDWRAAVQVDPGLYMSG